MSVSLCVSSAQCRARAIEAETKPNDERGAKVVCTGKRLTKDEFMLLENKRHFYITFPQGFSDFVWDHFLITS